MTTQNNNKAAATLKTLPPHIISYPHTGTTPNALKPELTFAVDWTVIRRLYVVHTVKRHFQELNVLKFGADCYQTMPAVEKEGFKKKVKKLTVVIR